MLVSFLSALIPSWIALDTGYHRAAGRDLNVGADFDEQADRAVACLKANIDGPPLHAVAALSARLGAHRLRELTELGGTRRRILRRRAPHPNVTPIVRR